MILSAAMASVIALAAAPAPPPVHHASADLYLRFERIGYTGNVYLNADGTYVIVQTGPERRTEVFTGGWVARNQDGLCIQPEGGRPGKCFDRMPRQVGEAETISSDLGEAYLFRLLRGR